MSNSIKAIAFDMGGTLLNAASIMIVGANYAAEKLRFEHFLSAPDKFIRTFFEVDAKTSFPHVNHLFSHLLIVSEALEISGTLESNVSLSTPVVASIFLVYYRDKIRTLIQPSRKLQYIFKELRARGFRLGIISNGSLEEQIEVLTRMKLIEYFDDILVSGEIGVEKPDPSIFLAAANRLGVLPSQILFIGDSWDEDICGASEAGLQATLSVEYNNDVLRKQLQAPNYPVLEDIKDVLDLANLQ